MSKRVLSMSLSFALALAGCVSDPVYNWRALPDADVAILPAVTMEKALPHLYRARTGYRRAVEDQLGTESSTSRFLLGGAGVLMTAIGLKAPSDVLLVGAATSATAYTLASSQLPRARISAYLAGIDALNCAETSIGPLRSTDYARLKAELLLLDQARDTLRSRIDIVQAHYEQAHDGTSADALVSAADTQKGANTVLVSTQSFLAKVDTAAAALHTQVEKIDKSVTQAIVSGTPDISQIKQVSAGLGSNISAILAKAVTDSNTGKSAPGGAVVAQSRGQQGNVSDPLKDLLAAQQAVQQHMLNIKSLLPANYDSLNAQALSDCGLPALLAPFTANPAQVQFFVGKPLTRTIDLSGGKKEYVVDDPVKPLPAGMRISKPGPTGTTLDILLDGSAASTAAGDYELRLHDQSQATDGSGTAIIKIKVSAGAKGSSDAPAGATPAQPGPAATPQQAILELGKISLAGAQFTIATAKPRSDNSIAVGICEAIDDQTRRALANAIKSEAMVNATVSVDKEPALCQ
ncbi:hypothetical protein GCN78_08225 [Janthinobacterium rivuli]|uniref:hypothetical protein n=1 Tax=Janthinobacterium sp. FT68W TaxID=2654255 RepID=UPI001265657F|nr:hypothetical protein [Janthinobacterium sp. FT68W]KAB8052566.1 hypothetical protein GCN78_08225 [Janthinobacterium sp. FT68W]